MFAHWGTLTNQEKQALLDDVAAIDPKATNNLYRDLVVNKAKAADNSNANLERIEPELVLPAEQVG